MFLSQGVNTFLGQPKRELVARDRKHKFYVEHEIIVLMGKGDYLQEMGHVEKYANPGTGYKPIASNGSTALSRVFCPDDKTLNAFQMNAGRYLILSNEDKKVTVAVQRKVKKWLDERGVTGLPVVTGAADDAFIQEIAGLLRESR